MVVYEVCWCFYMVIGGYIRLLVGIHNNSDKNNNHSYNHQ